MPLRELRDKGAYTMKRILLKLSGEALAGPKKTGFDEATVMEVAKQVKAVSYTHLILCISFLFGIKNLHLYIFFMTLHT